MKIFKWLWWVILLILFSLLTRGIWWPILKGKDIPSMENGALLLLLIWTALLFWPIIEEINLFGLLNFKKEIKKEIESVKEKVGEIHLTVSLGTPPYTYGEVFTPEKILKPLPQPPPVPQLSNDALKVLSTLCKHQKQYLPKTWGFAVGANNDKYGIYSKGVSETNQLGLTGFWSNGMTYLTSAGMAYCKTNEDKLFKDWDYQRWQKQDVVPS